MSPNVLYLGDHVQTRDAVPISTRNGLEALPVHGRVIDLGHDIVRVKSPEWPLPFRFAYRDLVSIR